ncbi:fructose-bisphosphate aldolase [Cellulomonas chitinilytica]|uniref:Fructose-bisphosphate aldolase n=1 Tax=Cellulomonas chitinilytica TaxID=398759 RepID=A0A919P1N8_9CELL|nr:class II fructose-bisphosphate aldolase [Cellulomonas chitinilytica]GIG20610.1 fructose-bisphosphate aldolase [Cellulomonas chitinilytica]
MPLVPTAEIVDAAAREGRGVGAFNVLNLEYAEAHVIGAERAGKPVIIQMTENCARHHGSIVPLGSAMLAIARASSVPVSVHLDHATDPELVQQAVELGFTSIMFDASKLEYAENAGRTAEVTARCHDQGVYVEAELGEIGGKGGAHAPGVLTDPDEAAQFVKETGVDALAVAVGSQHSMRERSRALDLPRITAIRDRLEVPLVLHGSSGVPDDEIGRAIEAGMTKVNIATHLNGVFTRGLREYLESEPASIEVKHYLTAARDALADEITRLLGVVHA